jgi:hypothetical protein
MRLHPGGTHDAGGIAVSTVKDVMASLAYFRDKLGFDVAFEFGNSTYYVGLCSGEVSLHLIAASQTPRLPGQACATSTLPTSMAT